MSCFRVRSRISASPCRHDLGMRDQCTTTSATKPLLSKKAQSGLNRAERLRERIRLSQTITAHRARIEAAGGKPSEDETARMISEFLARGGQVTICPPSDDTPTNSEPDQSKRR